MARRFPWYLKPVVWLWRLACLIASMIGKMTALILGVVMILAGFLLSLTIAGAIIGVPLMLLGGMLILCSRRKRGKFFT